MKKHEVIKAFNCLNQLKFSETAVWFEIYKNIKTLKELVLSIEEDRTAILAHKGVFNQKENLYEFDKDEDKVEALNLVSKLLEEEVIVKPHIINLTRIISEKHSADIIGALIDLNIILDDTGN